MQANGKVGVLIADDHPDVANALTALLLAQSDFVPLGTVATARDLLAAVDATHPEIVMVDWELPGLNPRQAVAALRQHGEGPQIVAMSAFLLAARAALAAGADVFISKTDPPESVLAILRRLRGGPTSAGAPAPGEGPDGARPTFPPRPGQVKT
ncbi:MAG: response regulator [Thermoflexales bacterium]